MPAGQVQKSSGIPAPRYRLGAVLNLPSVMVNLARGRPRLARIKLAMQFSEQPEDHEESEHTAALRAAATSQSTWVSVAVNVVLSATQIIVGTLSKSQGLIADGIHSLSDLVADFVGRFASHHSKKAADENPPYGHHRFETAASMVLGVLLLAVGVGMSWSALLKLRQPETIAQVHSMALWVAGFALVAKGALFASMLPAAKKASPACRFAKACQAGPVRASSRVLGRGLSGI